MINLKYIRFFNKKGLNITSSFENNMYNINVYVGKVNCGMFETEKIIMLEEVLREIKDIERLYEYSGSVNNIFVDSFDIKILKYIYSYGNMKKSDLLKLMKNVSRGYDSIEEEYEKFITRNEKFLNFLYDRGETYIFISLAGKNYLEDYENKKKHKYNATVDYVRPIDIYNEENEVSFIYYRWKNNDNDRRFFVYVIDTRYKESVSLNKDVNVCGSSNYEYHSIIPLYNEILDYRYNSTIFELFYEINNLHNYNNFSYEYPNLSRYVVFDVANNQYEIVSYFEDMTSMFRKYFDADSDIFFNRKSPIYVNIAFYSNEEGIYDRTLEVYHVFGNKEVVDGKVTLKNLRFSKIADITFYVEFIGKDERLEGILSNFGWNYDPKYTYVFGNEDVEDDSINYMKYNEKNKQLIMIGPEIFNYLGSYKSFFNVLKWLEYENIKVNEYFYKLDSNNNIISESIVEIYPRYKDILEGKNKLLHNKVLSSEISIQDAIYGQIASDYIKSARYGLVVPISKYVRDDEEGNPIYEYIYVDNIDEIFVKLYGLKKLLEEKFLPHHARIINITVEGIYLLLLRTVFWNNHNDFKIYNLNDVPNIKVFQNGNYVKNYLYEISELKNLLMLEDNIYYYTKIDEVKDRSIYFYKYSKCIADSYFNILDYKDVKFYIGYNENYIPAEYSYYLDVSSGYLYKRTNDGLKFLLDTNKYYFKSIKLFDIIKNIENFQDLIDIFTFKFKKGPGETTIKLNKKFKEYYGEFVIIKYEQFDHSIVDLNFSIKELKYFKISDLDNRISLYKVKNISDNSNYFIRWEIFDDNNNFLLIKEGYLEDLRSFIVFLPVGSYNVKCILIDINNVPSISLKRNIINIVPPRGDIYLLSQYSDRDISIIKNLKNDNVSIKNIKCSVYGGSYLLNALNIKVKETKDLLIKYLNFGNINNINYFKDYIQYDDIEDIDFVNKKLYLKTDNFYYIFDEFSNKWMNKNVVLENLDYKNPYNNIHNNYKINIRKNKEYFINLSDLHNLNGENFSIFNLKKYDVLEFFNLYSIDLQNFKKISTGKFIITNIKQDIFENIANKRQGLLFIDQRSKRFIFTFIVNFIDLKNNLLEIFIDESVYEVDMKNITAISYKFDEVYLRVIDINSESIILYDFRNEIDKGKNYKYFVINPFNYKYLITIKDVFIENNRTVVSFDSSCDISFLNLNYKFLYTDNFSIDYANLWTNCTLNLYRIKRSTFKVKDLKYISFEDILYTYPMYLYWVIDITGFNKRIVLGNYKLYLSIDEVYPNETIFDYYLRKLRTAGYPFNLYDYYIKGFKILAISKKFGSKYLLEKNLYGDYRFSSWDNEDELYNKYPYWYLYYKEKQDINKNNFDKNIYYIDGSFRIKNLFISNNHVHLPKNIYIMFIYSNEYIDENISFNWIVYNEIDNKVLVKSNKNYLGFRFVDEGLYTISLEINYYDYKFKIIKRGFVYIK